MEGWVSTLEKEAEDEVMGTEVEGEDSMMESWERVDQAIFEAGVGGWVA